MHHPRPLTMHQQNKSSYHTSYSLPSLCMYVIHSPKSITRKKKRHNSSSLRHTTTQSTSNQRRPHCLTAYPLHSSLHYQSTIRPSRPNVVHHRQQTHESKSTNQRQPSKPKLKKNQHHKSKPLTAVTGRPSQLVGQRLKGPSRDRSGQMAKPIRVSNGPLFSVKSRVAQASLPLDQGATLGRSTIMTRSSEALCKTRG